MMVSNFIGYQPNWVNANLVLYELTGSIMWSGYSSNGSADVQISELGKGWYIMHWETAKTKGTCRIFIY